MSVPETGSPTAARRESSKKNRRKQKRYKGPKSTDRHCLYEEAVQSPEEHIEIFDRVYVERHGHPAALLKEDFCGTALLSAHWVRARPENQAVGVDLDEPTLEWAKVHNIEPLSDEERSRVSLILDDVRSIRDPKVDIVAALNFSYSVFKTREELRGYFEAARASLKPGGMMVLDMFGGWESQMEETDRTRNEGFTYVWKQAKYDPITHHTTFHIHFKFHGGGGIDKAFVYEWRLWTIPEIRELLAEAGYEKVDIYWEQIDEETEEGNGEFERVTEAENSPGWVALLVAW